MLLRPFRLAALAALATLAIWSAVRIGLPAAGPSAAPPQSRFTPGRDLESVLAQGRLRVALGPDEIDYSIYRGQAEGLGLEEALAFATHLRVDLRLVRRGRLDAALRELSRGELDLVVSTGAGASPVISEVLWSSPLEIVQPVVVGRRAAEVRHVSDLAGSRLAVRRHSALEAVARRWSRETGGAIELVRVDPSLSERELAEGAATGRWPLVLLAESRARLEQGYFSPLELSEPLPPSLPVRWALNPAARELAEALDDWLRESRRSGFFAALQQRYLENPLRLKSRRRPVFRSAGARLSPFDALFRRAAEEIGLDWRLLAALAFAESGYDRWEISSSGAMGLLQIMPTVARAYGAEDPFDPEQNVSAGAALLGWLYGLYDDVEGDDRIAFTLASYNFGLAHLADARALAALRGLDPDRWEGGVAEIIADLEDPAIAEHLPHGRARGTVTRRYVNHVLELYRRFSGEESRRDPAGARAPAGTTLSPPEPATGTSPAGDVIP